jgi:hypothetical protein
MEFMEAYPDHSFSKRAEEIVQARKRHDLYVTIQQSRAESRDASGLERIEKSWTAKGQQNMYCKVAIWEALSGTNGLTKQTPASIARYIRLHVYVSKKNPWDGIAKGDKI